MSKLRLMPLYDVKGVMEAWHVITEGMEKVLVHSHGDTSMEKIFNQLMAGHILLWMGFVEDKYCGFVTTSFDDIPTVGKQLNIRHVYIKRGMPKDILFEGFERLIQFGKKFKCDYMRFWTDRDEAFEERLKDAGFERSYTEFVRKIEEEKKDGAFQQ